MVLFVPAAKIVFADQQNITNVQGIELFVRDSIVIMSDRPSIQRTFLEGNLTAVTTRRISIPQTNLRLRDESGASHPEIILRLSYGV